MQKYVRKEERVNRMKLVRTLNDSDYQEIEVLIEEFNSRGCMSTEELMIRLDVVPYDEFQEGLKEKIQNYDNK
jgi:hypothetical protein